jgi:FkbM family methyltransferase
VNTDATQTDLDRCLQRLHAKGVRYSTVIDVGCADGHFYLEHYARGLFRDAIPVNIDANDLYEPSLRAIQQVVGGHYRICAVSDYVGEAEVTQSVHPYWSSLRPQNDSYWTRINNLASHKSEVPASTLDTLIQELNVQPPFLLKLDIQGAEQSALQGAKRMLCDTQVVVCEADIADFHGIDAMMVDAGFVLYDATLLSRLQDGTLGWFYPIYINRRLEQCLPRAFWDAAHNDAVIRMQSDRRAAILRYNAAILDQIKERFRKG